MVSPVSPLLSTAGCDMDVQRSTPMPAYHPGRADLESSAKSLRPGPGHVPAVSTRHCVVCGRPLTVHQMAVGQTCAASQCSNTYLRRRIQEEAERKLALESRAMALRSRAIRELSLGGSREPALAVLPSNDRPVVNLPGERLRQFRDRLQRVISEAAERHLGNRPAPPGPSPEVGAGEDIPDPAHRTLLGAGCALCRGHCCPQGGAHAFIYPETIVRYMQSHPGQRPRDVLAAYLSRIGKRTYKESCVYHGPRGCLLPRDMRSLICNGYLCAGLNELVWRLDGTGVRRGFAVATTGQNITRTAILGPSGLTELPWPAASPDSGAAS